MCSLLYLVCYKLKNMCILVKKKNKKRKPNTRMSVFASLQRTSIHNKTYFRFILIHSDNNFWDCDCGHFPFLVCIRIHWIFWQMPKNGVVVMFRNFSKISNAQTLMKVFQKFNSEQIGNISGLCVKLGNRPTCAKSSNDRNNQSYCQC